MHDPAADADDESEHTPDAPPPKRQKLRIPMKKKPGEKPPASRDVRIQDPTDPPVTRTPIDTTDMVVESPLAIKPPCRLVPTKQRTKSRHDPKNKPVKQPEADVEPAKVSKNSKSRTTVAKPGQSYA